MLPGLKFGWLVTSENILNEIESARFIYETNNPTMDMVDYVCNNPEYFDYFRESVMIKRTDIMKKMLLNEQANISSHAKSFKPYGEFTYNIRLYSEDKQHVARINQNFLDNKIVVGTHEDTNLYFSVPMTDDVERAVYRSLEMGDNHE